MRQRKGYITRQAKRLSDGEINRRRFVMSALSAGVTLPTAMSLASKAEAGVPKRGGVLRIATAADAPGRWRDGTVLDGFETLLAFARGNALTEITADGHVVGELAHRLTPGGDYLRWTIDLRPDVVFHDGEALTAAHVFACLRQNRRLLPHVTDIRTDGALTVFVSLDRPDPALDRRLADPRLVILKDGIGTGGYQIDISTKTDVLRLVRVAKYWKPDHAHVDAVELVRVPDLATRVMAVTAGDVDYVDGIDPRARALLQHTPGTRVLDVPGGRNISLLSRDAEKLHLAATALPDPKMVEQVLLGHGHAAGPVIGPRPSSASGAELTLVVEEGGIPSAVDVAQLVAGRLVDLGHIVHFADPGSAPRNAVHVGWQRAAQDDADGWHSVVALWANDLTAHRTALAHGPRIGRDAANDGGRLIERWWFA